MALKAAREGIKKEQVDYQGNIISDALAPRWKKAKTYSAGDYVIYKTKLFQAKVNLTGVVPKDGQYWKEVSVADEVSTIKNTLSDLNIPKTYMGYVWSGAVVKITAPQKNSTPYFLIAKNSVGTDNSSILGVITIREDGTIKGECITTTKATFSYNSTTKELTITLPTNGYWTVHLMQMPSPF